MSRIRPMPERTHTVSGETKFLLIKYLNLYHPSNISVIKTILNIGNIDVQILVLKMCFPRAVIHFHPLLFIQSVPCLWQQCLCSHDSCHPRCSGIQYNTLDSLSCGLRERSLLLLVYLKRPACCLLSPTITISVCSFTCMSSLEHGKFNAKA